MKRLILLLLLVSLYFLQSKSQQQNAIYLVDKQDGTQKIVIKGDTQLILISLYKYVEEYKDKYYSCQHLINLLNIDNKLKDKEWKKEYDHALEEYNKVLLKYNE